MFESIALIARRISLVRDTLEPRDPRWAELAAVLAHLSEIQRKLYWEKQYNRD
jgi:hypothetical protein